MRVLVTRPLEDAEALAGQLSREGHQPIVAPVLEIRLATTFAWSIEPIGAVIATSRNALRAVAASPHRDRLQAHLLYAVGAASAGFARSLGWQQVIEGPGTAEDLAAMLQSRPPTDGAGLLVLRGADVAFDMAGHLRRHGWRVEEVIVYGTEPVAQFDRDVRQAIASGDIDAVLLLSPKSARAYAQLLLRHDLSSFVVDLPHFCLSSKVARALAEVPVSSRPLDARIADVPRIEGILDLVNQEAARSDVNRRSGDRLSG